MHELGVTQHLLNLALEHAGQKRAERVNALHLAIGELSGFVDESVRFCWDFLSRGSICEGAELSFRKVPAVLTCLDCGSENTLEGGPNPCSRCGSGRLKVTGGTDLVLESLDLEIEAVDSSMEERA